MMNTIGTNRTACIGYEDGSLSERFDLGTGRPQGDTISPIQFNIGEQILILKIELDPTIRSIFWNCPIPRNRFQVSGSYRLNENNRKIRLQSPCLDGGDSKICSYGTLIGLPTDYRINLTQVKSVRELGVNLSTSFDMRTLKCGNCKERGSGGGFCRLHFKRPEFPPLHSKQK